MGITVTIFMVGTAQTRDMGNDVSLSGQDPFWHSGPLRIDSGPFPVLRIRIFAWRRGGHSPLRPPIYLLGGDRAKKEIIFLGQLSYHAHKPPKSEI